MYIVNNITVILNKTYGKRTCRPVFNCLFKNKKKNMKKPLKSSSFSHENSSAQMSA